MEAPHHQSSNNNNLYKFRNQDLVAMSERPKTSNNIYKTAGYSQQTSLVPPNMHSAFDNKHSNTNLTYQGRNQLNNDENRLSALPLNTSLGDNFDLGKKQRGSRPLSGGGLSKMKSENARSRINKVN